MIELISYYWPRYILGLIFALSNAGISVRNETGKVVKFLIRALILFVLSATFVSIICELLTTRLYDNVIAIPFAGSGENITIGIFVLTRLICDSIAYIIPVIIFSKIIKRKWYVAATIYFMFVLVDKLCLVLAISAVSYFFIMLAVIIISTLLSKGAVEEVIEQSENIEWRPVLHYQMGLFFLLETLYSAYFVFPGIVNGNFDLKNVWLNFIAIVSYWFFIAFTSLNLKAAREKNEKLKYLEQLQDDQRDIIQTFAEISEAKSGETGQHVRRVAEYSALLAEKCGLDDEAVEQLRVASMMHDVGKLLIPREIIEKPGDLNEEEWRIMQQHTVYGNDILSNSSGDVIEMAREIAYQHHEHWDGTGYPNNKRGIEISLFAQIVSVADVYDALTSKRAYKEPWTREEARAEIVSQSGRQFSPQIVEIFDKYFDKISEIQDTYRD